jgi:hypothetical protein
MATTISILCFSAAAITLVTWLSIRSQRAAEATTRTVMAALSDTVRTQNRTTEMVSADLTELAGKEAKEAREMIVDLYLGRERGAMTADSPSTSSEKQSTPGIETYEGLPNNVVEALRREQEEERPNEWRVVSSTPPNGSEPLFPATSE